MLDGVFDEIVTPRTDAGALSQVLLVAVVTVLLAVLVRRERALVLLVIGVGVGLLGVMSLRTLH